PRRTPTPLTRPGSPTGKGVPGDGRPDNFPRGERRAVPRRGPRVGPPGRRPTRGSVARPVPRPHGAGRARLPRPGNGPVAVRLPGSGLLPALRPGRRVTARVRRPGSLPVAVIRHRPQGRPGRGPRRHPHPGPVRARAVAET